MTENSDTLATSETQDQEPTSAIGQHDDEDLTALQQIRELVFKAYPDVVPQLIQGESIAEILSSVEPAKRAYSRISERIQQAEVSEVHAASFAPAAAIPEPGTEAQVLTAAEKIRFGLQERIRQSES